MLTVLPAFNACINRNIVECKGQKCQEITKLDFCINRNIVECKDERAGDQNFSVFRINRNIVECKVDKMRLIIFLCGPVLIETSWNVKESASPHPSARMTVLIETSWNVKDGSS